MTLNDSDLLQQENNASQLKGKKGIKRLINAFGSSGKGLKACFLNEDAFRQECMLFAIMLPVALFLPIQTVQKALLCVTLFLVLLVVEAFFAVRRAERIIPYDLGAFAEFDIHEKQIVAECICPHFFDSRRNVQIGE